MPSLAEHIVCLDFETYFAKDYSLRLKQYSTSKYIRDPQFKAQCVAIKIDDQPVVWYRDIHVATALRNIDWHNSALLAHNAAFDGLILTHHFGHVPAYYFDTLSMARGRHSNAIGAGLNELASFYQIGNKLPDVLDKTKGVRELTPELMTALGQYCAVDVELCRHIFNILIQDYPVDELDLINETLRMFCEPVLELNAARLEQELEREQNEKSTLIEAAGTDLATLSSATKFAAVLSESVTVPFKISPTTKKVIFALSKSDQSFIDLLGHENPVVRALVAARLAAKSTIGESRARRLLDSARTGGRFSVSYNYYAAHTGRWGGADKINLQNLPRGGELRKSILAPEGHVLVVCDSAQIEARVLAWLADDTDLLELFRSKIDVYVHMARTIYGLPAQIDKLKRFVGKVATLGLGYGMGHAKLRHTLAIGSMGPPVFLSETECKHIVSTYRTTRWKIKNYWTLLNGLLVSMVSRSPRTLGPIRTDNEFRVWLPNGMYLQYPFLCGTWDHVNEKYDNFKYYNYKVGFKRRLLGLVESTEDDGGTYIWGGYASENFTQALARIIIGEQLLTINKALQKLQPHHDKIRRVVMITHDEIVCCVPENEAQWCQRMMEYLMCTPPKWASDLPLGAESSWAREYSK